MKSIFACFINYFPEENFNPVFCKYTVLVAQPKILKINFVNIITKFYITI